MIIKTFENYSNLYTVVSWADLVENYGKYSEAFDDYEIKMIKDKVVKELSKKWKGDLDQKVSLECPPDTDCSVLYLRLDEIRRNIYIIYKTRDEWFWVRLQNGKVLKCDSFDGLFQVIDGGISQWVISISGASNNFWVRNQIN
jgi:hypothetical protein